MPLSSETIPNKPLTGPELMEFVLYRLREEMKNTWVFAAGTSYPRVAFSAEVTFHFANPNMKTQRIRARVKKEGAIEGEPPLENAPDSGVKAFELEQPVIDNPNLARVHADMPIEIVKPIGPEPGKNFGSIERHAVRYDKRDYPPLPPAKVTDRSKKKADDLGVVYDPLGDPEDLEAVGTEDPE